MARVRDRDTKPELVVRRLLHALGFRFRLHRRDLPGTPDIVLPRHRAVVFVNGCFWHAHACTRGDRAPQANAAYWKAKRRLNQERDARNQGLLAENGWRVLIVWECELRDRKALQTKLATLWSPLDDEMVLDQLVR